MRRHINNRLFKKGHKIVLEIIDLEYGGKGLAKINTKDGDFTCFVENTLPGQKVLTRVIKCKKNHAICKLIKVLKKSKNEIDIPYQIIPGAPYSQIPINIQEKIKKQTCFQLFKKIGQIENIENYFDEFISSPLEWHYRNKMEYSFSAIKYDFDLQSDVDDFAFGFKHRGTWWIVENLEKDSGLFDSEFENIFPKLRDFFKNSNLPPWHPPKKIGFFKYLVARKSFYNNKILLNLVTTSNNIELFDISAFISLLKELLGNRFASLYHSINDSVGDRTQSYDGKSQLVYGDEKIVENLLGLNFEISTNSFFQTNPKCAEKLYQKVIDYVKETNLKQKVVMDLFCGTGTIGQILSKQLKNLKIIGVDIESSAISDANKNARRNKINNLSFYNSSVGKFLQEFPEYIDQISTIIIDPPRAGIAPKTLKKVVKLNASRIIYISCNPIIQARDTKYLVGKSYQLKKISFVDQFPHTSHLESIALFEK